MGRLEQANSSQSPSWDYLPILQMEPTTGRNMYKGFLGEFKAEPWFGHPTSPQPRDNPGLYHESSGFELRQCETDAHAKMRSIIVMLRRGSRETERFLSALAP